MIPQEWRDTILADPDDDAPRLICADWLSEHGDEVRAGFIRDQCALAHLWPWEAEARRLHLRIRNALARHGRRWIAELPDLDGVTWGAFERGFVSHVHVHSVTALHTDAVRRAAPIRGVTFAGSDFEPRTTPDLSWIREVHFASEEMLPFEDFEALLDGSIAQGLEVLDLRGQGLENRGVAAIVGSPPPNLIALDLTGNFVGNEGLEALCGAEGLSDLQYLSLASFGSGYVDDPFVTELGHLADPACALVSLAALHLAGRSVPQSQLEAVIVAPQMASLHTLGMAGYDAPRRFVPGGPQPLDGLQALYLESWLVGEPDLDRLFALPQLGGLQRVILRRIPVSPPDLRRLGGLAASVEDLRLDTELDEETAAILAGIDWPRLHTLHLNGADLGPGEVALLAGGSFPSLARLSLGSNPRLGDEAATAIASASWAPTLRSLDLFRCGIGPAGARALSASPALGDLVALRLTTNPLGIEGATAVMNGAWSGLTDLDLACTDAEDAAVAALTTSAMTDSLLTLDLSRCGLTGAAFSDLAAADLHSLCALTVSRNVALGEDDRWSVTLSSDPFPALISLQMTATRVDPSMLVGTPLLERLHRLEVYVSSASTTEAFYAQSRRIADLPPCPWVLEFDPEPAYD